MSSIQTYQAVANPIVGKVELTLPGMHRKAEDGAPICYSLIHDRPRVRLARKNVDDQDEADEVLDLRDKKDEFFHPGGKCPCTLARPRPVSEEQRKKQITRIARRDERAYYDQPTPDQCRPRLPGETKVEAKK